MEAGHTRLFNLTRRATFPHFHFAQKLKRTLNNMFYLTKP